MLLAGVVVHTDNAALHDSKDALNAVRGYVPAFIFTGAMVDLGVPEKQAVKVVVDWRFISIQS